MYVCSNCDYQESNFFGICPNCGEAGTAVKQAVVQSQAGAARVTKGANSKTISRFRKLSSGSIINAKHEPTGIPELDRVLGGGIVPSSYILMGAPPGAGKSTLAAQILDAMAELGKKVALVAGEESQDQILGRFKRLGIDDDRVLIHPADEDLDVIAAQVIAEGINFLVVDSIQTVRRSDIASEMGSTSQVKACSNLLLDLAKNHGCTVWLIGQVIKDGTIAGPKHIEHLVDVVLSLEGDRQTHYRFLRAHKNRFGPDDEMGLFEMTGAHGLVGVEDGAAVFVRGRNEAAPGSVICPVIEGSRPLLVEVQALVNKTQAPQPIRAARGIDQKRFQMMLAVLNRHCGIPVGTLEVFLQIADGLTISDPGLDAAICAAIVSAYRKQAVPDGSAFCGEISLIGEVRPPLAADRRAKEAEVRGFPTTYGAGEPQRLRDLLEKAGLGKSVGDDGDDDD